MVKFVNSSLPPNRGCFALDKMPLAWEWCRERFASYFHEDTNGFFFSHNNLSDHTNIREFLEKTEEVLALSDRTKIEKTNCDDLTWVEPTNFWKCCSLRRNLFTVFLRCGLHYNGDYYEALMNNPLSKPTYRAICRFLYGFTKYTGNSLDGNFPTSTLIKRGWVEIFTDQPDDFIRRKLVKESTDENRLTLAIDNALWI
jgi:hypothetical protein